MATPSIKPILLLIILTLLSAFCNAQSTLNVNGRLTREQSLINGVFRLTMQTDCNLVLYDNGRAIWATNTAGRGTGCSVVMRENGDLAVYLPNNAPIWLSNTARGNANYYLTLQSDRNLVIYAPGGTPIWATNTQNRMNGIIANETAYKDDMVIKQA
ncbi:hypothetical protein ACHQM5_001025 [Ranunculus cassubicifolius]